MSLDRRRRVKGGAWLARFAALLVGLAVPALASVPGVEIIQNDRHFSLAAVKVALGTTIRFLNQDEFTHHIEVDTPSFAFDSGEQQPGQVVQVSFNRSGTFDVHCAIHPKMHLLVEVQ
jgi:plastocyanin